MSTPAAPAAPSPRAVPQAPTQAAVELAERLRGTRPLVVVGGRGVSGDQLGARLRGLVRWLDAAGVGRGDRVLLWVPAGGEFVCALLALLWRGATVVLVDPAEAPPVWRVQVAAAAPRWVLVPPALASVWAGGAWTRWLRRLRPGLPERPENTVVLALPPEDQATSGEPVPEDVPADHPALVIFTSGTTAAPRGIVHSHGSLGAFLRHVRGVCDALEFESCLAETPQQMFYALARGAACHVVRGHGLRRARAAWRTLHAERVEAWFGAPWVWARALDHGARPPASLRALVLGSAPVSAPFLRRVLPVLPRHTRVRCVYGLTEIGPACHVDGRDKAECACEGDLLGAPLAGVSARTQAGEIQLASPALAPATLAGEALGPWLSTGDLGRLGPHGLELHGRRKDMLVRRGRNLYPELLEPLLTAPGCEVALVGLNEPDAVDERLVLFHAGRDRPALGALPAELRPDHVLRLPALPRAGRQGKVDKQALRRLARERLLRGAS